MRTQCGGQRVQKFRMEQKTMMITYLRLNWMGEECSVDREGPLDECIKGIIISATKSSFVHSLLVGIRCCYVAVADLAQLSRAPFHRHSLGSWAECLLNCPLLVVAPLLGSSSSSSRCFCFTIDNQWPLNAGRPLAPEGLTWVARSLLPQCKEISVCLRSKVRQRQNIYK